jgi:hypothetical protein
VSTPLAQPASSPPEKLKAWHKIVASISIAFGVSVCALKALVWSGGEWNAEVGGYSSGGVFLCALISYLIAGRRKVRNAARFWFWFSTLAFIFLFLEFSNHPRETKNEVADLLREASGTKPVEKHAGLCQGRFDSFTRGVFREFFDGIKAHNQKVDALSPDLAIVYSATSYSTPAAMQKTLEAVQNVTALDHEFLEQTETWPTRVRQQVANSSLSKRDKEEFLKGFDEAFASSTILAVRREADKTEAEWRDGTVALYAFALKHSRGIRVKGENLIIPDDTLSAQFNGLQGQAIAKRKKLNDADEKLRKSQNGSLQKAGLTKKDVGLSDQGSSGKQ